jgi:hypothetical protein
MAPIFGAPKLEAVLESLLHPEIKAETKSVESVRVNFSVIVPP